MPHVVSISYNTDLDDYTLLQTQLSSYSRLKLVKQDLDISNELHFIITMNE